ncbi:MAG: J domain-containing protein [Pseudomonadota bacterium]
MSTNSKYFDSIRIKPGGKKAKAEKPKCDWPGCDRDADHKAPKGRGQEGDFFNYCIEHVREYNKTYNYFSGMDGGDARSAEKASSMGERPTWKFGVNAWTPNGRRRVFASANKPKPGYKVKDPFDVMDGQRLEGETRDVPSRNRPARSLEIKSLHTLNLDETATKEDIRTRYKELVKMHHPDVNDGDRASEDRLRDVILAYRHLKSVGFC